MSRNEPNDADLEAIWPRTSTGTELDLRLQLLRRLLKSDSSALLGKADDLAWSRQNAERLRSIWSDLGAGGRLERCRSLVLRLRGNQRFNLLLCEANRNEVEPPPNPGDPGLQLFELVAVLHEDLADRLLLGLQTILPDLYQAAGIPDRANGVPAVSVVKVTTGMLDPAAHKLVCEAAGASEEDRQWKVAWGTKAWTIGASKLEWASREVVLTDVSGLSNKEPAMLLVWDPSGVDAVAEAIKSAKEGRFTKASEPFEVRRLSWSCLPEKHVGDDKNRSGSDRYGWPCPWLTTSAWSPTDWIVLVPPTNGWPAGSFEIRLRIELDTAPAERPGLPLMFPAAVPVINFREDQEEPVLAPRNSAEGFAPAGSPGKVGRLAATAKWKVVSDRGARAEHLPGVEPCASVDPFAPGLAPEPEEDRLKRRAKDLRTRGSYVTPADWRHALECLLEPLRVVQRAQTETTSPRLDFDLRAGANWNAKLPHPAVDVLLYCWSSDTANRRKLRGYEEDEMGSGLLVRAARLLAERIPLIAPLGITIRVNVCLPLGSDTMIHGAPRWLDLVWKELPEDGLRWQEAKAFAGRLSMRTAKSGERWSYCERIAQQLIGNNILSVPIPQVHGPAGATPWTV